MKCRVGKAPVNEYQSLSSWRAWIEIDGDVVDAFFGACRSPHGERGLKYAILRLLVPRETSLSSWRAWIEIAAVKEAAETIEVALLMESVD